jgi:hypothetical protein
VAVDHDLHRDHPPCTGPRHPGLACPVLARGCRSGMYVVWRPGGERLPRDPIPAGHVSYRHALVQDLQHSRYRCSTTPSSTSTPGSLHRDQLVIAAKRQAHAKRGTGTERRPPAGTTVAHLPEPRPQPVAQEPEPRCQASTGTAQPRSAPVSLPESDMGGGGAEGDKPIQVVDLRIHGWS